MSFQVQVTGAEPFSIEPECTKHVKFSTDIPMDSDARTKDVGATLVISGKILANATGAAADSTQITPDAEVSDTLEGTYALSSIEVDEETNGEYFNSDDLEILDYLDLESVQMSMFDDGTLYISIFGTVTPGTWEIVDEGVIRLHDGSEMISTDGNDLLNYTVADGRLVLEQEGVTVTFDKLSDTPSKFSENPEELKDTETDAK